MTSEKFVIYFVSCLLLVTSVKSVKNETDEEVIKNNTRSLRIVENSLQKSIMEHILDIYVLTNSTNETCRLHSLQYCDALKNFEPWAMKMLDASSKFQAGIMAGDLMEYGSFTQCVKIQKAGENYDISGKYCTFGVLPPEELIKKIIKYRGIDDVFYENIKVVFNKTQYDWSICVPDSCDQKEVYEHFRYKLDELFEGLNITLVDNVECSTLAEVEKDYNAIEITVIGIVGILCLVVAVSTGIDIYKSYHESEQHGFEQVFSMLANTRYLMARNKSHENMACLNGIRTLSIVSVIIGHRFLMTIFFPNVNTFELVDVLSNYSFTLITGATVCVDSFLVLSAVLLTYHFLLNHQNGGKFNLLLYYLHRYLRLTPSYAFTILITACFAHRFGMGPKWQSNWRSVQQPCQDYWWSALLYVQSYVNPKEVCILQSWYLSADTFYYFFAPFLLIPLAKYEAFGLINIFIVYVASVAANFVFTWKDSYAVHSLLDNHLPTSQYFVQFYTQPHVRASPYILGIVFGYVLFKFRTKKVNMNIWTATLGWIASMVVMAAVVLSNRIFLDPEYVYDRLGSSLYIAIHRSLWTIALGWILWACIHGYGGPVNTLLSSHFFTVFAKLTYSAYLIHMQLQYIENGANKLPNYFSYLSLIRKGFGDLGVTYVIGYFLTILIEFPVYRLSVMLFRGNK